MTDSYHITSEWSPSAFRTVALLTAATAESFPNHMWHAFGPKGQENSIRLVTRNDPYNNPDTGISPEQEKALTRALAKNGLDGSLEMMSYQSARFLEDGSYQPRIISHSGEFDADAVEAALPGIRKTLRQEMAGPEVQRSITALSKERFARRSATGQSAVASKPPSMP